LSSSTVAYACPACLGQQQTWTGSLELLGLMLLVPFAVAALVAYAIRRADHQ
jgi:hypothetical protein